MTICVHYVCTHPWSPLQFNTPQPPERKIRFPYKLDLNQSRLFFGNNYWETSYNENRCRLDSLFFLLHKSRHVVCQILVAESVSCERSRIYLAITDHVPQNSSRGSFNLILLFPRHRHRSTPMLLSRSSDTSWKPLQAKETSKRF